MPLAENQNFSCSNFSWIDLFVSTYSWFYVFFTKTTKVYSKQVSNKYLGEVALFTVSVQTETTAWWEKQNAKYSKNELAFVLVLNILPATPTSLHNSPESMFPRRKTPLSIPVCSTKTHVHIQVTKVSSSSSECDINTVQRKLLVTVKQTKPPCLHGRPQFAFTARIKKYFFFASPQWLLNHSHA